MKKIISLLLSLTCVFAAVRADEPAKTSTNAPTAKPPTDWNAIFKLHWANRVAAFKAENLNWQNVVLLGDSITEGFEVTKYFAGRRVLNRGIGADVIGNAMPVDDPRGVLQRLDNSVFDCAPTDVFILIGINDLNAGHNVEQMTAGYRQLLKRIRERRPDLRLYVQSLLPTRDAFAKHNPAILEFNRQLKALAAEFNCQFIDLHSLLSDDKGELKAECTKDGLHLTEPGYQIWREQVLKALHWQ